VFVKLISAFCLITTIACLPCDIVGTDGWPYFPCQRYTVRYNCYASHELKRHLLLVDAWSVMRQDMAVSKREFVSLSLST
jgi:hypothetical protein